MINDQPLKTRDFANSVAGNAAPATGQVIANLATDSDGWLTPAWLGEFPHPMGLQVVEAEDLGCIMANYDSERARLGGDWTGVMIYEGHPDDGPAVGWLKDWRVQDGKLQLKAEWNAVGAELLENKAYKFISVSWPCTRDNAGNLHPYFVYHVGLTNAPVIKGQAPLVNAPEAGEPDNADGGWWASAIAKLGSLVGNADSAEAAQVIIDERLGTVLCDDSKLDALQALIDKLSNTLGVTAGEDGAIDHEALTTAAIATNSAVDRAARLERELADETAAHNGAIVDTYIARNVVDAGKRAAALAIVTQDRQAAIRAWSTASAAPPNAAAPQAPPEAPFADRAAFDNAAAGSVKATPAELKAITDAAKARIEETKCDPSAANAWAWDSFAKGKLPIANTEGS